MVGVARKGVDTVNSNTLILLCLLLLTGSQEAMSCQIEQCTREYTDEIEAKVLKPSATQEYCRVLYNYVQCLSKVQNECHSFLHFHSSSTAANQRWRRFKCARYPASDLSQAQRTTCTTMAREDQRTCALFGLSHLRRSDGAMETCAEVGARPLVDNKFMVVQVTTIPQTNAVQPLAVVSKVTVMFRANSLCEETRVYQADAAEAALPSTFLDGTTYGGDDTDPPISLRKQNRTTVRIFAAYLAADVVVQRHRNGHLSVVLNLPERVLHLEDADAPLRQLCLTGCPTAVHDVRHALGSPDAVARCQALRPASLSKTDALDLCRQNHVRGDLHAACAFDVMFGERRRPNATDADQLVVEEWHELVRTLRYFDALRSTRSRAAGASVLRLAGSKLPRCANHAAQPRAALFLVLVVGLVAAPPLRP